MTARAITSLQNDTVKLIRSLDMRKVRRERGLFVAEGASLLLTAREQGWTPKILVVEAQSAASGITGRIRDEALAAGAEVLDVSPTVMEKLAARDNPQTVLAVFEQRFGAPPALGMLKPGEIWLALERVRDPGNLGTIIRTLDAVGATGLMLVGPSCDPYSKEAVRASMGSIFASAPTLMTADEFACLAAAWPGSVVATDLDATVDFRARAYAGPVLLLMGSEGPGLSDGLLQLAKQRVKIPMAGRLDSLNLSIATALMLYQIAGPKLSLKPPAR